MCMFFEDFSELTALKETKVAPFCMIVDNTSLWHVKVVGFQARAWHTIDTRNSHMLNMMATGQDSCHRSCA